ncbi:unnamed protein product, partial [Laminaria digitata]
GTCVNFDAVVALTNAAEGTGCKTRYVELSSCRLLAVVGCRFSLAELGEGYDDGDDAAVRGGCGRCPPRFGRVWSGRVGLGPFGGQRRGAAEGGANRFFGLFVPQKSFDCYPAISSSEKLTAVVNSSGRWWWWLRATADDVRVAPRKKMKRKRRALPLWGGRSNCCFNSCCC